MKIIYHRKFLKDFEAINNKQVLISVKKFLLQLEETNTLQDFSNIKKLSGTKTNYRARFGSYRMGFRYEDGNVILDRILQRKTIYKLYP